MAKKKPDWFQDWIDHDFNHFVLDVKTNKRLIGFLIAMVAAILVRLFIG